MKSNPVVTVIFVNNLRKTIFADLAIDLKHTIQVGVIQIKITSITFTIKKDSVTKNIHTDVSHIDAKEGFIDEQLKENGWE